MGLDGITNRFNEKLSDIDKKFNGDYDTNQDVTDMIEDLSDISKEYNAAKAFQERKGYNG
ncbi:hypothetical protein G7084_01345 [Weissella coleopterorum]|uniref:Uncharacterized protein n=1 Tax=Weissella coleopterorum TaxID=2714949 RepID=A0A6G8AYQ1_9LACO|nr:hypothetical protein [Weissella coleopterorum]QIL50082.1 hypothetical protein G7084_01345 [Weissella coleopterorum]